MSREKKWALAAILGATFMLLVDVTIVQVALPTIRKDLHASFTSLQWVIDAYTLTLAALLLTSGSLADRFGRKRVFLAGVTVFSLASLLCGLATSPLGLDSARALQGIGGAGMLATSLALIAQEFTGAARRTAIALWGAAVGAAVAIGPLVGGALTEWAGWRWIFFVNVPIGAAVIAASARRTQNVRDPGSTHADAAGLVAFSGMLFLFVFALLRGNAEGWTSRLILAAFAGAAVLAVAFVAIELRQHRPMFDLTLFRNGGFGGVSLGTLALGIGLFGLAPYLTFYLQDVLGYSPLQGALRLLPLQVPTFAVPILAQRYVARLRPEVVLGGGLAVTAAGVLLLRLVTTSSGWQVMIPGLIATGIGIGVANPAIAHVALAVVPAERSGMASGISNTCRMGGLAVGVAALGALLEARIQSRLGVLLPGHAHGLAAAIASSGTRVADSFPAVQQAHVAAAARVAFVTGLHEIVLVGGGVVLAGAIAAAALVRTRHIRHSEAPSS